MGLLAILFCFSAEAEIQSLENSCFRILLEKDTGKWSLEDKRSGVRWPTHGKAEGKGASFKILKSGSSFEIRFKRKQIGEIQILKDFLKITDAEKGYVIVPCREGLLIPSASGGNDKTKGKQSDIPKGKRS